MWTGTGLGTLADPFRITSAEDFAKIGLASCSKSYNGTGEDAVIIESNFILIDGVHTYRLLISEGLRVTSASRDFYNEGSGYSVGDRVQISDGSSIAIFEIQNVLSGGKVGGVSLISSDQGFTKKVYPSTAITGNGTGLRIKVEIVSPLKYIYSIDEGAYTNPIGITNGFFKNGLNIRFDATKLIKIGDGYTITVDPYKHFLVENDIDWTGRETPETTLSVRSMYCSLDGGGHSMTNVTIGVASSPLFDIQSGAQLKNLTVRIVKSVNSDEYTKERTLFGVEMITVDNVVLENLRFITYQDGGITYVTNKSLQSGCRISNINLEGRIGNCFQRANCVVENLRVLRTTSISNTRLCLFTELGASGQLINSQHIILSHTLTSGMDSCLVKDMLATSVIDSCYVYANLSIQYATTDTYSRFGLFCSSYNYNAYTITNCLFEGSVNSNKATAQAIVGNYYNSTNLSNCVINADIVTTDPMMPLFARASTNCSNNYYNRDKLSLGAPVDVVGRQTGLSALEFGMESSFTGLDFEDKWEIVSNTPVLKNNRLHNFELGLRSVDITSIERLTSTSLQVFIAPLFISGEFGVKVYNSSGDIIGSSINDVDGIILLPEEDGEYTVKSYYIENGQSIYNSTQQYFHYCIDAAVSKSELAIQYEEALNAAFIHGTTTHNGYLYGSTRGTPYDPKHGVIVRISMDSPSSVDTYEIRPASATDFPDSYFQSISNMIDRHSAYMTDMEAIVVCKGYLYTSGSSSVPKSGNRIVQYCPTTHTYKVFLTYLHISTAPLISDGEYLYLTVSNGDVYKVDPIQFQDPSLPQFNTSDYFPINAQRYDSASQGAHLIYGYDSHFKGEVHSGLCDAEYIYVAYTTARETDANGYSLEYDKTCHELHKIRKSDMTAAGYCVIPKSTDDCTQTTTHIFFGIEVQPNSHPNTLGRDYGAYAVRKSDMKLLAIPRLHSLDDPLTVQSYASLIFGNYLLDFKTNRMVYVIDITDVDNWLPTEHIGKRTILALDDRQNSAIPINEAHLMANGVFIGTRWGNPSKVVTFNVPQLTFFKAPTIQTLDAIVNGYEVAFGGYILDTGGKSVSEAGFVWGVTHDNLNNTIQAEIQINTFSTNLQTLSPGVYYYRAFASNSEGIGYGDIIQFMVISTITVPSVSITASVNDTNIYMVGSVLADGGANVLTKGFLVSRDNLFSNFDDYVIDVPEFTYTYTATEYGTFYARAYAVNSQGVAYSEIIMINVFGEASAPSSPSYMITSISLTWSQPHDLGGSSLVGYKLYRHKTTEVGEIWEALNGGEVIADNTYIDEVGDSGPYKYRVSAVTEAGESNNYAIIPVNTNMCENYSLYIGNSKVKLAL